MGNYKVKRCICHQRTFESLKNLAEREEIETVEELQRRRLCGRGCGMCVPYVRLMLETGKTAFDPKAIRD
jgi:bacterioferritin-associated ferredoxin